jgi:hypothetical protein
MDLEELMDVVVVVELSATILKMLNPVETCVTDLRRKTLLYLTFLNTSNTCTRESNTAYISFERSRH